MCELKFKIYSADDTPGLLERADKMVTPLWPEFMHHDQIANKHWHDLYERFGRYQFALEDEETGELFASANSIPLRYDGDIFELPERGWDWAFETGVKQHQEGIAPNLLCAIQIAVDNDYRGLGISPIMVDLMRDLTDEGQFPILIAPVRPNLKAEFPLTSIDEYIGWVNDDDELFDPWLRVHQRAGAVLIRPCHEAMLIKGTIKEWESWTDTIFPRSGQYIIPGALIPIEIDLENNLGVYREPNVWMAHPIR